MEALANRSAESTFWRRHSRTDAKPRGIKISELQASAIHLPEALIHKTPFSFMELLPVLACVSSGLLPTRADSSSKGVSSLPKGISVLIRSLVGITATPAVLLELGNGVGRSALHGLFRS